MKEEAGSKQALSDEWDQKLAVVATSEKEDPRQTDIYETLCGPICAKGLKPQFWTAHGQFIKLLGKVPKLEGCSFAEICNTHLHLAF